MKMFQSRGNVRSVVSLVVMATGMMAVSCSAMAVDYNNNTVATYEYECKVPPQFWCDDVQLAKACGVYEQCQTYSQAIDASPVSISLYYESLCPGCRYFIINQLYPTYQKVGDIMNILLVPYGNAREHLNATSKQWIFECQHGEQECVGNLIETCAMWHLQYTYKYLPFINCMENHTNPEDMKMAATKCGKTLSIDVSKILDCTGSTAGNLMEHLMGVTTEKLQPPHQYTPWIVVNGVHTDAIQNKAQTNLLELVCQTYRGPNKPAACKA